MQIVLGLLIAAVVGGAIHFLAPHRETRGAALAPLAAVASGGVVWTALTWAGFGIDNPLLWLSAAVVPAVVTLPLVLWLSASRTRADEAERARLRVR
jgi:hypothetical protein